jgi:hypothetical protein
MPGFGRGPIVGLGAGNRQGEHGGDDNFLTTHCCISCNLLIFKSAILGRVMFGGLLQLLPDAVSSSPAGTSKFAGNDKSSRPAAHWRFWTLSLHFRTIDFEIFPRSL